MVRIGERQSLLVNFDTLNVSSNGDIYEDMIAVVTNKPLDVGRLFYVKLRLALDDQIEVEVYWDHFKNLITGVIRGRDSVEAEVQFYDGPMARTDRVVFIDQLVERIKEAERSLLE